VDELMEKGFQIVEKQRNFMSLPYQRQNNAISGFFCHSDIVSFKLTILKEMAISTIFVSLPFVILIVNKTSKWVQFGK